MRELKFRQYGGKGFWHFWGYLKADGREYFELPLDRRPIVSSDQFTGLKDKAGREIYENDIIEDDAMNGVVAWDKEWSCWSLHYGPNDISATKSRAVSDVWETKNIIGNIYESPELLK